MSLGFLKYRKYSFFFSKMFTLACYFLFWLLTFLHANHMDPLSLNFVVVLPPPFSPCPCPTCTGNQSVLCILWAWLFFIESPYKWDHKVFVFLWLISLNIMASRSITLFQMARFHSFYGWKIFCFIYACVQVWPKSNPLRLYSGSDK